ncbi:ACP S-malonyltransferase [Litoribacillus peritrichatus]|uniref:Malonyl CoA-acyl carrier protein transacylase n=1 Tax=Litoribacillus peritrichatus TaxID=718191 RepID=A0ABP7N1H8_9GAMM
MSSAFVFPGQGSQLVAMGSDFYDQSETFRNTLQEASDALEYDLWKIIKENSDDQLNQTQFTQPALLAVSIGIYRSYLDRGGVKPVAVSGHSLGEYSALVAAGVIDFADAIRLVGARGKFMQEAVPAGEGAMAAVMGLDLGEIQRICAESQGVVEAANLNAPGQIVIAGSKESVVNVLPLLKEAGAKRAIELPVSVPSHCSLMRPAAEKLEEMLSGIALSAPSIDVVHNVSAMTESDLNAVKLLLVEQLYSPVRWVDCIEKLKDLGAQRLIECGPGKVLAGLTKRIDRSLACSSLGSLDSMSEVLG